MNKNLWGDLPSADDIVSPAAILKEQANYLERMTGQVLQGDVEVERDRDDFMARFWIRVPALDDYRYWVLRVKYPLDMYPLAVDASPDANVPWVKCRNQEEFEHTLAEVFTSSRVRKAIAALQAQAKA